MRRRVFIASAAAAPFTARAQEPGRTYRIGFLTAIGRRSPPTLAFLDELRRSGFIEGHNLTVLAEGFDADNADLAALAVKLVAAAPDVLMAGPELPLRAVKAATDKIPVVGLTADMVAEGFAASLARPGGNITGISLLTPELDAKRQGLLVEMVPAARRLAVLYDPNLTQKPHLEELAGAAQSRGVALSAIAVFRHEEIAAAIDAAKTEGADGLNILPSPLVTRGVSIALIVERLSALHLPAIFPWPEVADAGGLLAYGSRFVDMYRQRARMAVKILRGAKPADMPVEQPTRFDLVLNLKAARAIGLSPPPALLARADEVIE